jgi:hypothetical protein
MHPVMKFQWAVLFEFFEDVRECAVYRVEGRSVKVGVFLVATLELKETSI